MSSVTTRFFGRLTTLDDLTMLTCVAGGMYFWLARGKIFGELGQTSVGSVAFAFIAVKFNSIMLRNNAIDAELLVKGYKIVFLSLAFDYGYSVYKRLPKF
jgi:hypothetical protein